jgi:hypothetical protein
LKQGIWMISFMGVDLSSSVPATGTVFTLGWPEQGVTRHKVAGYSS